MSSEQVDPKVEAVLDRRAVRLASQQASVSAHSLESRVALVSIGGEKIGIPVDALREIIKLPPLVALPKLPPWLPGIVQVRGEILCAVDLMAWLGRSGGDVPATFLAVLEGPHGALGVLVDAVLGFRDIYADELADELVAHGERQRAIRAVTKDLVSLLDAEQLLDDERIVVEDHAAGGA